MADGKFTNLATKVRRYIVHDILRADDSPHRLALGCAIGMFVAFTPTIPFQMMLTIIFCIAFGANKAVGLPIVWITNPATLVPIYFPQYLLGCFLTGRSPQDVDFTILTDDSGSIWDYSERAWEFMSSIFWPLWIGSVLVSVVLGIGTYYFVRSMVIRYRRRRYGSIDVPT